METEKVKSDFFIGREDEIRKINLILRPNSNGCIICLHSAGESGVGKSKILLQAKAECIRLRHVQSAKKIIDFYHTECQLKLGVLRYIAESLGIQYFSSFTNYLILYDENLQARKTLLDDSIEMFIEDYNNFSQSLIQNGKFSALFFDTYEVIQKQSPRICEWLEKYLFPELTRIGNTKIFVAGRRRVSIVDRKKNHVEEVYIRGFNEEETKSFISKQLEEKTFTNKIGRRDRIGAIHKLTSGHPIILALLVDWLKYNEENTIEKLFEDIDFQNTINSKYSSKYYRNIFTRNIVRRFAKLDSPEDLAITYMAIAYRRMNPTIFSHLTGIPEDDYLSKNEFVDLCAKYIDIHELLGKYIYEVMDNICFFSEFTSLISDPEKKALIWPFIKCLKPGSKTVLLKKLRDLSFIKYKGNGEKTILLHDKMRDLIKEFWWKPFDLWEEQSENKGLKKQITSKLVGYYDQIIDKSKLSSRELSPLLAERLYYALCTDIESAINKYFIPDFREMLTCYDLETCNLLLEEVKAKQFIEKMSIKQQLECDYSEIRKLNEEYDCKLVIEKISDIRTNNSKLKVIQKEKRFEGDFLLEEGVAFHWLNEYEKAFINFEKAENIFRKIGKQSRMAYALNWQGYTCLRSCHFEEAVDYFWHSIDEFIKLPQRSATNQILTRMAVVYANLGVCYRNMGNIRDSLLCTTISVYINDDIKDDRELIRSLNALADSYKLAHKHYEAQKTYEEAFLRFEKVQDKLLQARVLAGKALLSYRHYDHLYIFEYYRRGKEQQSILESFRKQHPPRIGLDNLLNAKKLLKDVEFKKEHAEIYFDIGEYYLISEEWDEAIQYFNESARTALIVKDEYRAMESYVKLMVTYYYKGFDYYNEYGEEKYFNDILKCQASIEKITDKVTYHNLIGRMYITLGAIAYDQYIHHRKAHLLIESLSFYIIACDEMYAFNMDRFYSTLRIVLNRCISLFKHFKYPFTKGLVEEIRDIWLLKLKKKRVFRNYRSKFDEILNFILLLQDLKRGKISREAWHKIIETYYLKIENCIEIGKLELGFAPFYAEMHFELSSAFYKHLNTKIDAYRVLGRAYFKYGQVFESQKNYEIAEKMANNMHNRNIEDELTFAITKIGLAKAYYRQDEFSLNIEHYILDELHDMTFSENYKKNLKKSDKLLKESEEVLENLSQNIRSDSKIFNQMTLYQCILNCRKAEYLTILKNHQEEHDIYICLKEAISYARKCSNVWWEIKSHQLYYTFCYVYQWWQNDSDILKDFDERFKRLNLKQYSPKSYGLLELTKGNLAFDRLLKSYKSYSNIEEMEKHLREAFSHYALAIRYHSEYSYLICYDAMLTVIRRIKMLNRFSIFTLNKDIMRLLQHRWPIGEMGVRTFDLVRRYSDIRGNYILGFSEKSSGHLNPNVR